MTKEEIQIFKDEISKTIMPVAEKMTEEQIKALIDQVSAENPDLPEGFGNMLYEQILIQKYNKKSTEEKVEEESKPEETSKSGGLWDQHINS